MSLNKCGVDGAIVIREEEEVAEGDDKKYSDTIHQINYIFGEPASRADVCQNSQGFGKR